MNRTVVIILMVVLLGAAVLGWLLFGGSVFLNQQKISQVYATATQSAEMHSQALADLEDTLAGVQDDLADKSAELTSLQEFNAMQEKFMIKFSTAVMCERMTAAATLPYNSAEDGVAVLEQFLINEKISIDLNESFQLDVPGQIMLAMFTSKDTFYVYVVYEDVPAKNLKRAVYDISNECFLMYESLEEEDELNE